MMQYVHHRNFLWIFCPVFLSHSSAQIFKQVFTIILNFIPFLLIFQLFCIYQYPSPKNPPLSIIKMNQLLSYFPYVLNFYSSSSSSESSNKYLINTILEKWKRYLLHPLMYVSATVHCTPPPIENRCFNFSH